MPVRRDESPVSKTDRVVRRSCWTVLIVLSACCHAGCDEARDAAESPSSPVRQHREEFVLLDSNSQPINPFAAESHSAAVFLFTGIDCPISNRYAPEVQRFVAEFAPRGVAFWLVYSDPNVTPSEVREHLADFEYPCPALVDSQHQLVRRTGVHVTPEAAVYDDDWQLVYRGRIDNRFVDFGQARREPTTRDLQNVLDGVLSDAPIAYHETDAIGCPIPTLP